MIRVVLDTNVLAPGFISDASGAARLLSYWRRGDFELVISEHILEELVRTFHDPYFQSRITSARIELSIQTLREWALMTELSSDIYGIATHPEDDLVIATALSGKVAYLVTRDRQLLKLGSFGDVEIIPPGRLLAILESAERDEDK